MSDQHTRMLLQIAEARRMHGTSERLGSIHQVWRKNKEQKVRINIGKRPDGSPWLTPWLKVEDHHGSKRKQRKFHKGMNVKVQAVGADFSQATVTPHGENQAHPEPDIATDDHETEQYAKHRERTGPDFSERWLADMDDLKGGGAGGSGGGGSFGGGGASGSWDDTDPDKQAVVLQRVGAKPDQKNDKQEPWDGPDPKGGTVKKRTLHYAGKKSHVPKQTGEVITKQFDKDVKTEHTQNNILHKIQSPDGQTMNSPDSGGQANQITIDKMLDGTVLHQIVNSLFGKITTAIHTNGDITHLIQDNAGNIVSQITQQLNQIVHQIKTPQGSSTVIQQAEQIIHKVGDSVLQILKNSININSQSVNINTVGVSIPTTPQIPSVSNSGDAPLMLFPTQWPIEAGLAPDVGLAVNFRWTITARLAASAIIKA